MNRYIGTELAEEFKISKLYSVHYFEYSKNFSFNGERHNFWELVYVDKGEITVVADKTEHVLSHGKMIFHKPDEWHELRANGETAPNLIIVSFECNSPAMSFFENKIVTVGQSQKNLLSRIMVEYSNVFSTVLDNPATTELEKHSEPKLFGAEQLIRMYIAELLILFMRESDTGQYTTLMGNRIDSSIESVLMIMNANVFGKLSLSELSRQSGMSIASLSAIFTKHFKMGVMDYFFRMKTEVAKKYLREDNYNITQISEILGYNSIHYFSRQFKKITGMTPTQYANSVKALAEINKS